MATANTLPNFNYYGLPTTTSTNFADIMGTQQDPYLISNWNSIYQNRMSQIPLVSPFDSINSLQSPKPAYGPLSLDGSDLIEYGKPSFEWATKSNFLNASITGFFTGLANLAEVWSSQKLYDLYREQEQLYIDNANEQARRLQIKGDFALANLRVKHAIVEGQNELSVAGARAGGISGSFLDKLMANKKYGTRDEVAQSYETLWAVYNARRDGLLKAYETAGKAYEKAIQQRNTSVSRLFTSLAAGVSGLLKDKQASDTYQAQLQMNEAKIQAEENFLKRIYGDTETAKKILEGHVSQTMKTVDLFNILDDDQYTSNWGYNESGALVGGVSAEKKPGTETILDTIQSETDLYNILRF